MPFCRFAIVLLVAGSVPCAALAQSDQSASSNLHLELNNLEDIDGVCRLTFVARNETGTAIDRAVFETVIFNVSGSVTNLSLFDFRDLPADGTRVRQFDLPETACNDIGQTLINGANSCVVEGVENTVCKESLSLSSRLSVELLG